MLDTQTDNSDTQKDIHNSHYGNKLLGDLTDTLDALGLTIDEINADPRMADALKRAIAAQED